MASVFLLNLMTCWMVVAAVNGSHYPRIMSSDGNVVITPAKGRNISLDVRGFESFLNIGRYELLHLLFSFELASRMLLTLEKSESPPIIQIQQIQNILNGRKGILSRLNILETQVGNSTRRYRIFSPWNRLTNMLRNLETSIDILEDMLLKNKCQTTPCKHGGICIVGYNSFNCLCPKAWEGNDCSIDVNECDRFAKTGRGCQNGATCINQEGGYKCLCPAGLHGVHCTSRRSICTGEEKELCGHGTCNNSSDGNSYTCTCDQGWKNDGYSPECVVDVDECSGKNPCSINPFVPCVNAPGSFRCGACPTGYSGDGYTCTDIDECQTNNGGCSNTPLVQCINMVGYRICGPCPPGYEGDGTFCTYKGLCQVNNGDCHPLAKCSDNPSISWTYVACACPSGYTGHGYGINGCTPLSSDITIAHTEQLPENCYPNPCVNGKCVNSSSGQFCICNEGFSGIICEDLVDQCSSHPCKNGGTCIKDSSESPPFRCKCTSEFTGSICQTSVMRCGGMLDKEEGSIVYQVTNNNSYQHHSRCAWVIKTKLNMVLNLTFTEFNIEQSESCNNDWLQIHDGLNSADRLIGQFCGNSLPQDGNIISTSNLIYLLLVSDHTKANTGFSLSWTSMMPLCGGDIVNQTHGAISSPGSPGKYPLNRDCLWTIRAQPGKRILLHFFTMQISSDPSCSEDYLDIHDGILLSDILLLKYCNDTNPPPFTSPGPELLVHFHSDGKDTSYGFQMTYSIVEGIPGCGGVYSRDVGELTTPTVKNKYLPNMVCEYLIRLPLGTTVKLTFVMFKLEYTKPCTSDYLAVYDGPSRTSDIIGKYCGNTRPDHLSSTSNTVLLVFNSDSSKEATGFRIKYELSCHKVYTESTGIITSPGYPNNYESNRRCTYLIRQPSAKAIIVNFLDIDIERSFECSFDHIKVYDGDSETSPLIRTICGAYDSSIHRQIISTLNFLFFEFNSDKFGSARGFRLNYTTFDLSCGAILNQESGYFSFPDMFLKYKFEYVDPINCKWIISAPDDFIIQISWISFDLEHFSNCSNYIDIIEGNTTLQRYCGKKQPFDLTSSSNMLTINLVLNKKYEEARFSIWYDLIDPSHGCGGNYTSTTGVITSPGWPEEYFNKRDCRWIIHVPKGQQILLNFTSFSLEKHPKCNFDYLQIRNGGYNGAPLIGTYCGKSIPKTFTSLTNSMFIHFHANHYSIAKGGFHLTWESTATGCGGTLFSSRGTILSPNYPHPYHHDAECYWKVSTSLGSQIYFEFQTLDLSDDCDYEYVQIFDNVDKEIKSLGKFCKNMPISPNVESSSNHAFIKFHSGALVTGTGFILKYRTMCTRTITQYSGVIESLNFPNAYPANEYCTWKIIVPKGNKINITFSHFEIESARMRSLQPYNSYTKPIPEEEDRCELDYVSLYDSRGQQFGHQYCGRKIPPLYTSSDNVAFVHFVSDYYLAYQGFRLEWNIVGCGGLMKGPSGTLQTPGYPRRYPSNTDCNWIIEVDAHKAISLIVSELDVGIDSGCEDSLSVYDGLDTKSHQLVKLCHKIPKPVKVTSTGRYMYVGFSSNENFSGRGLKATFISVDSGCGGNFASISGVISSLNNYNNNKENTHCFWNIETLKDHRISIKFSNVHLNQPNDSSCIDYVNIYDGNEPLQRNLIATELCGNELKSSSFVSITNKLLIELKIYNSSSTKGFTANYSTVCGSTIYAENEGFIKMDIELFIFERTDLCSWTIIAIDPEDKISLAFTHLDIRKTNFRCNETRLLIYNGESNKAPLNRKICFDKSPPTILSDGNTMTIELINSDDQFTQSFEAQYSVMSTACGGDMTAEHGSFTSPTYPNSYPTNVDCVWEFSPSAGNKIILIFIEFDIEFSDNCDQDYLEIRDSSPTGKILGIFCGDTTPTNVTVGANLWVKFHSDGIGTSKGFYIDYSYLHGNELNGDLGVIESPLYPKTYKNIVEKNDIYWRIYVAFGSKIRIQFKEIFITPYDQCDELNSIFIYDGYSETFPLLANACGYDVPEAVETVSNVAYITWSSNELLGSKFVLEWTRIAITVNRLRDTVDRKCGEEPIIFLPFQSIFSFTSPGYPDGYEGLLTCKWKFETDPINHLGLEFVSMDIKESNNCVLDHVSVFSVTQEKSKDLKHFGNYCLKNSTKVLISVGSLMEVQFNTDVFVNGSGFSARVYTRCGNNMTSPEAILKPSYPSITNSNENLPLICEWSIEVKRGRTIKLKFLDLNITNSDPIICDNYVVLRNGASKNSPYLGKGKYCGDSKPTEELETIGNNLYVRYEISTRFPLQSQNPFRLKYYEESADCGFRMTLTETYHNITISSLNYLNLPKSYKECTWIILAPPGERIKLDFNEKFDLTKDEKCTNEFVEICDGGTLMSKSLGKFCNETPVTQKSTGNIMYIRYLTNLEEPRYGFEAIASIDICGGTIYARNGFIAMPKNLAMFNQKSNIECEWHVIGPSERIFWFHVKKLKLPHSTNCSDAYLKIEDAMPLNDVDDSQFGSMCSISSPISIGTSSEHAILKLFIAKQMMKEFDYDFLVTYNTSNNDCGDILVLPEGFISIPTYNQNMYCYWRIIVPHGRRVTLEVLSEMGELLYSDSKFIFFNDFGFVSKIKTDFISGNRIVESSSNIMGITYRSQHPAIHGFKAKYTSKKPSICGENFSQMYGVIDSRRVLGSPYYCEYSYDIRKGPVNYRKATIVIMMKDVAIGDGKHSCENSSKIMVSSNYVHKQEFCGNYSNVIVTKTLLAHTVLSIIDFTGQSQYTISYEIIPCGGFISLMNDEISRKLKIPDKQGSIDCAWILTTGLESIEANTKNLKLTGTCNEEHVTFQKLHDYPTPIFVLCSDNISHSMTFPAETSLRIIYHSDIYFNDTKLDIEISVKRTGCGGTMRYGGFSSPHFPLEYGPNEECFWIITADKGFRITLFFENRFALEKSENCSKDFVEVFDFHDGQWSSIAKVCGRDFPNEINSTSEKMKVIFRSDDSVNGDGFEARWKQFCGGEMTATDYPKILLSPANSRGELNFNCKYKISAPPGKYIRLSFDEFNLEEGQENVCVIDSLTISENANSKFSRENKKRTFCGTTNPGILRYRDKVDLHYKTDNTIQKLRFIMKYQIDVCGGFINSTQKISSLGSTKENYDFNSECLWNITAPKDKIIILKFEKFEIDFSTGCTLDYLTVYDGDKEDSSNLLAKLCGNLVRSLPAIHSYSNQMIVKWVSDDVKNSGGFEASVIFSYGESYGCGGKLNITKEKSLNFSIDKEKLYKPFMDCHWVVTTSRSDVIRLSFSSFNIAPCSNASLERDNCACDYVEVRDGSGPFSALIGVYCGYSLPDDVVSSRNKMRIRFVTDGTVESTGMQATLKNQASICGERELLAENTTKELISPTNSDGSLKRGIRCKWKIESSTFSQMHLRFLHIDLSPHSKDKLCLDDILEITIVSNPVRGDEENEFTTGGDSMISSKNHETLNHKLYCGNMNVSDVFVERYDVYVTLTTAPYVKGNFTGFKLQYNDGVCSRNHTNDHGKIMAIDMHENCTIIIKTDVNKTISLFFTSVFITKAKNTHINVKDGPDVNSSIITTVQDNKIPNPIFSTRNTLRIDVNKYFKNSIINFRADYITSDKGRGCGGNISGESGMLSSPFYPFPFRESKMCVWEIMSPVNTHITLKFKEFDLGIGGKCTTNYVKIFEYDESFLENYCSYDNPMILVSNSNYLKIVQQGSTSNKGPGWLLEFFASY